MVVSVLVHCLFMVTGCGNGTWTNTCGEFSNHGITSLAYKLGHELLYAGTNSGVWKYSAPLKETSYGEKALRSFRKQQGCI